MPTFSRRGNAPLLRIYNYYRIGLGSLFLLIFSLSLTDAMLGKYQPQFFMLTLLAYLSFCFLLWPYLRQQRYELSQRQTFTLLSVDALILVILIHTSGGLDSGLR